MVKSSDPIFIAGTFNFKINLKSLKSEGVDKKIIFSLSHFLLIFFQFFSENSHLLKILYIGSDTNLVLNLYLNIFFLSLINSSEL